MANVAQPPAAKFLEQPQPPKFPFEDLKHKQDCSRTSPISCLVKLFLSFPQMLLFLVYTCVGSENDSAKFLEKPQPPKFPVEDLEHKEDCSRTSPISCLVKLFLSFPQMLLFLVLTCVGSENDSLLQGDAPPTTEHFLWFVSKEWRTGMKS